MILPGLQKKEPWSSGLFPKLEIVEKQTQAAHKDLSKMGLACDCGLACGCDQPSFVKISCFSRNDRIGRS